LPPDLGEALEAALREYLQGGPAQTTLAGGEVADLARFCICMADMPEVFTNEVVPCSTDANMRPLRRRNGAADFMDVTHPPPDDPHPWYQWRVERVEALGGDGDWLTNDFFLEAFWRAVVTGGGSREAADGAGDLFDFQYNQDFRRATPRLERRGGVLYRVPAGWKRFGLNVTGRYKDGDQWLGSDGKPGEWAVAYHGTKFDVVPKILREGWQIGPRQGPHVCGLKDSRTGQPIQKGIFCTPNLTAVECYSNGEEGQTGRPPVTLDGHTLFFALQCRVRPGAIRRANNHVYTKTNNDEEVMGIDGVFEWVIEHPADIRPCGVLVRDRESLPNHKGLGQLAGEYARMKPRPAGAFDAVPGRIDPGAQKRAEEVQVRQMDRPAPRYLDLGEATRRPKLAAAPPEGWQGAAQGAKKKQEAKSEQGPQKVEAVQSSSCCALM